ncbi:MAG: lipoate--protein ligase family protein [Candidatus Omnitrophota bacterium]
MVLKDISFSDPLENILFDDVLLQLAEEGRQGEALRFWESEKLFIVLGRTSRPEQDLRKETVLQDNILVLRRSSGGGTVLQGKGCLNFSLILSKQANVQVATIHKSYEFILGNVIAALKNLGVDTFFKPISDLAMMNGPNEQKISGNAQKRGKKFVLHHGTVLYNFPLGNIERYLTIPQSVPEYRRGRSHLDFVANFPKPAGDIKQAIRSVFSANKEEPVTFQEKEHLEYLKRTRDIVVDVSRVV